MDIQGVFKPFSSLRNRNFRFYWLAEFPYYFALRSSELASAWLVYEMTKSPFLLGLMTAIAGVPQVIIALFGGVFADRLAKKNLLFIVQVVLGADALGLAVLVWMGVVQYWHVVLFILIWRTAVTFGLPGRLAFVSELVSKEEFLNAYALYYVALNIFWIVGPALAGIMVESMGVARVFFILAACQWSVNALLLMIRSEKRAETTTAKLQIKGSMIQSVTDILSFARHSPTILTLMGIKIALAFLVMPAQSLMPAFAAAILDVGAVGFGILQAANGIGRLVGSLLVASISKTKRKSLLMLGTCLVQGVALFLFAISNTFYLCFVMRLLFGIGAAAYTTLTSSLFQLSATDEMRGRVMGLYMLNFGFIGVIPLSAAAEGIGVPFAIGIGGSLFAVFTITVLILLPNFRRLRL